MYEQSIITAASAGVDLLVLPEAYNLVNTYTTDGYYDTYVPGDLVG